MLKPSICFVALNAYNLVSARDDLLHVGGAERQQWLMANWLLKNGYRVKFVTLDHGQGRRTEINGYEVISAYKRNTGLPGLRFAFPRWSGLWRALSNANCDIYYQRGAGLETGQVALWCRRANRSFVFACAAGTDCLQNLPALRKLRERALYRLGLRYAHKVFVQTESQRRSLKQFFGRDSEIVRNIVEMAEPEGTEERSGQSVLWVGRFSSEKRFEWLLDVAESTPQTVFEVVGRANTSSLYERNLIQRAGELANVKLHGAVPFEKMSTFYRRARLLCITSPMEGFPNAALEAWSAGVPVASTFDPDGVIKRFGLGWHCESVGDLVNAVRAAFFDSLAYASASAAGRDYCRKFHTADANMPVLARTLDEVFA